LTPTAGPLIEKKDLNWGALRKGIKDIKPQFREPSVYYRQARSMKGKRKACRINRWCLRRA